MSLFGRKDVGEFTSLEEYSNFVDELLNKDDYISKKEYSVKENELAETYNKLTLMENEGVLLAWCKNNKVDYKRLKALMVKYAGVEKAVKKHNESYISSHLKTDREYLDSILLKDDPNIKLDEEQRRVVLSDEDYTLVIAGAGAGKTTTIEA